MGPPLGPRRPSPIGSGLLRQRRGLLHGLAALALPGHPVTRVELLAHRALLSRHLVGTRARSNTPDARSADVFPGARRPADTTDPPAPMMAP